MNHSGNRIESTGSTLSQTGVSNSSTHNVGNQAQYTSGNPTSYFKEGQVVKGEVIDLRNHEVTISLSDHTTLKAYVDDNASLSIGQSATFKVTELSPRKMVLENISNQHSSTQDATVLKALEEADLPKTERNKAIVRELLNFRMPIHKNSIQQMIRYSMSNTDVSIDSLVLMKKYHLPMDKASVMQFENYRNGNHELIHGIENLSDSLPGLLSALSENAPEADVALFGQRLLSILTDNMPESRISNLDLTFMSSGDRAYMVEQLATLLSADETLPYKESILDGSIPLEEMRKILNSVLTKSDIRMEDSSSEINANDKLNTAPNDSVPSTSPNNNVPLMETDTRSNSPIPSSLQTIAERIEEQWQGMRQINQEIGSFLPQEECEELFSLLKHASLTKEGGERIQSGDSTLQETIRIIKDALSSNNFEGVKDLLSSHSFHSIMKEAIQTNWMLTPSAISQKEKVEQFYPKLFNELNEVSNLIQQNLAGQDSDVLAGQSKSMQQNIDFMKTLNSLFSYIQLPVHLKDKNVHSDLYVYTKKHDMKKHPSKLHALLHLDMDSLGKLDVDITLENNSVQTTFYCGDAFSKSILETNMELLEESLLESGYLFQAKVESAKKDFDMVKDLIEEAPSIGVKRYSFDIRA